MPASHITPNIDTKVEALNELSKKLGGSQDAKDITAAIRNITQVAESGGTSSIDELEGVSITDPADGQALIYDDDSGDWVNGAVSGGISTVKVEQYTKSLKPLSDVAAGTVGQFNASWTNSDISPKQVISIFDSTYAGRFYEVVGASNNLIQIRAHIEEDGTPIVANQQISFAYHAIVAS